MKKKYVCLVIIAFSFFKLIAQTFTFSGSTSVYPTFYMGNDFYLSDEEEGSTDMIALEDVSLRFEPVDIVYAQMDASCYGSVMQYKENDIAIAVPFTIDINQLYIGYDTDSTHTYIGKKVFNYGFSSQFPLVNQINPRRNNNISLVTEGTGAVCTTLNSYDWTSFSTIFYYDSDDEIGNLEDLSMALITDFYYKNFTFSVYSYFKNCFCWTSDMTKNIFTDFEAFRNEINEYTEQMQFPAAFSGSAQFGFFTLYSELLYQTNPQKFQTVEDSGILNLQKVEKGVYWDVMVGTRFVSSQFSIEIEYCRAQSGYTAEESDEIYDYIENYASDKDTALAKVYDGTRIFFRHNASLSFGYTPNILPQIMVSLTDKVSFPSYGCDSTYLGNLITAGIEYTIKQTLNMGCSCSYGFGGSRSEYTLYNENVLSILLCAKLYY